MFDVSNSSSSSSTCACTSSRWHCERPASAHLRLRSANWRTANDNLRFGNALALSPKRKPECSDHRKHNPSLARQCCNRTEYTIPRDRSGQPNHRDGVTGPSCSRDHQVKISDLLYPSGPEIRMALYSLTDDIDQHAASNLPDRLSNRDQEADQDGTFQPLPQMMLEV